MYAFPLTIDIILGNGGYKPTNIGSGGFKPTNSKNKSQKPILDTKINKQEEKDHLEETGSGAGNDDEDDNEDDIGHGPIPEEEEEDLARSGSINLNPKTTEDDEKNNSSDFDCKRLDFFIFFIFTIIDNVFDRARPIVKVDK